MQIDFTDKAVLVTGAGRGLGFAIAEALHADGARVAINDRTPAIVDTAMARLGGGPRLFAAPADLAVDGGPERAVDQALAALGGLDLLVNNAGVNVEAPIEATDDAHWDRHLAVDLKAPYFCARRAIDALAARKGLIVNIASELGLHAIANNVAYVSAKHGLVNLTRSMAMELAPRGVRVIALCPGTMDSELMQDCAEASGNPEAYFQSFRAYTPLGRLATTQEIAQFLMCLASPAAAFMTGAAVAIDGGSTAGR
jgi:NAD(P)-dependent dehydrogenase (short-subunit alcohol dehydrogenase family)